MFTPEEIETRLRSQPFVPIRVVTSLGQNHDITHPELVLVGRASIMIGVASTENPAQYDTISRVAIMHITDLQNMPRAASTGTNGAG
jgi:hypothetical protein